jgi:hypothetical protein
MGEVDAADPTELAPTENETASVRAWGLDEFDYDEELPTTRLTPGRITGAAVAASLVAVAVTAVLAGMYLHTEDAPVDAAVTSSMVTAAPMTTVIPVAAPEPKPPTDGWGVPVEMVPPPTKTVTVEKPPPVQMPPAMTAAQDRRFIANLEAKNWVVWDAASSVQRAHQVCMDFQQHASMNQIIDKLTAEAVAQNIPNPYVSADQFAYTVLETYICERR